MMVVEGVNATRAVFPAKRIEEFDAIIQGVGGLTAIIVGAAGGI
jgi:hypothetical protein